MKGGFEALQHSGGRDDGTTHPALTDIPAPVITLSCESGSTQGHFACDDEAQITTYNFDCSFGEQRTCTCHPLTQSSLLSLLQPMSKSTQLLHSCKTPKPYNQRYEQPTIAWCGSTFD
jgi:hypothetical protein